MNADLRSERFVYVPFCAMAQAFHANGLVKSDNPATIRPVIDDLLNHNVNIVQMPCPEATFGGLQRSLRREPMSLARYESDPEYVAHCRELAASTVEQMEAVKTAGYTIALILGIEYSPSCATLLHYTNSGTVKREGVFARELKASLKAIGLDVPYVGINKRGLKATIARINVALGGTI